MSFYFSDVKLEPVIFAWEKLSRFQRILLVKVLRLPNLTDCVRIFVEEQMNKRFISSGGIDLKEMFEESNAKTPLIFILSPGKSTFDLLVPVYSHCYIMNHNMNALLLSINFRNGIHPRFPIIFGIFLFLFF